MTMEDPPSGTERGTPASLSARNLSSNSFTDDTSSDTSFSHQRGNKRTFDVAFLVAPDENLARRKSEEHSFISNNKLKDVEKDLFRITKVENRQEHDLQERLFQKMSVKEYENQKKKLHQYSDANSMNFSYVSAKTMVSVLPELSLKQNDYTHVGPQKCSNPPSLSNNEHILLGKHVELVEQIEPRYSTPCSEKQGESKSAFTKVALNSSRNDFDDEQTSPRSSISPDGASYQSGVSSPVFPLSGNTTYKYCSLPTKVTYPFLVQPNTQKCSLFENLKISQIPRVNSPKVSTFRSDLSQVYPNLPYNSISIFPSMNNTLTRPRLITTAAGVAGLLPASLAALTLPAQNVCAKCNLSFRMTSDLVYHMRSHHKNESLGEAARRRREEKLRCPVCDESFRERHHLTRHMTAHQDKESDAVVDQVDVKRRSVPIPGK